VSDTLLRIITIGASVLSLVMIALAVRSMRRERPMSRLRPLLSAGIVALVTAGYLFITRSQVNLLTVAAVVVVGLLIGWAEGRLTRVYYKGNQVVGKQTGFYLIVWGLAYVLTLLLSQTNIAALHAGGIMAMMFGAGVALGSALTLLVRLGSVKPQPQAAPAWQAQPQAQAQPYPYYPAQAQAQVQAPTQAYYQAPAQGSGYWPTPPPTGGPYGASQPIPLGAGSSFCANCGNPRQPGTTFCTRCGVPLP
jgi:hypothetical protein